MKTPSFRTYDVPLSEGGIFRATASKAVSEELDYCFDRSEVAPEDDPIVASTWGALPEDGIDVFDTSWSGERVVAWIRTGTAGSCYRVVNTIRRASGTVSQAVIELYITP